MREGIMTTYSPTGKPRDRPYYYEDCETCGLTLEAATEKRLRYLVNSHRYWIHERGLAQ
jgi:hypothetical protein